MLMFLMLVILMILLVACSVALHELGHYEALKRCGIPIEEVVLGNPDRSWRTFQWQRNGVRWRFTLSWDLSSHVKVYCEIKSPWKDGLYILGAGPLASFLCALLLLAAAHLTSPTGASQVGPVVLLVAGLVWFARRYVTIMLGFVCLILPWVLTLLAAGLLCLVVAGGNAESLRGLPSLTLGTAFLVAGLSSFMIGLFALLPAYAGSDGEKMISLILREYGLKNPARAQKIVCFPYKFALYLIDLACLITLWKWFN